MTKIVCNRCGKEISGNIGYIAWNFRDHISREMVDQNIFENCDYCEKCMEEIMEFITCGETILTHQTAAGSTDPSPAAGQTGAKKLGKRNTHIDMGKVNALRDAGWSIGRIAEDMNIPPEDIAEKIYSRKVQEQKTTKV